MKSSRSKFVYRDHSDGTAKRIRQYGHIAASQQKARERQDADHAENRKALDRERKMRRKNVNALSD